MTIDLSAFETLVLTVRNRTTFMVENKANDQAEYR